MRRLFRPLRRSPSGTRLAHSCLLFLPAPRPFSVRNGFIVSEATRLKLLVNPNRYHCFPLYQENNSTNLGFFILRTRTLKVSDSNLFHRCHFSTREHPASTPARSFEKAPSISACRGGSNDSEVESGYSNVFYGIGRSSLSRCSHTLNKKGKIDVENYSLLDFIKVLAKYSPETVRRFWRVSALNPEDVLEILLGFGPKVELKAAENLWGLFRWAALQEGGDFHHLTKSFDIMISALIHAQMLEEAESLLQEMVASGLTGGCGNIVSEIILRYLNACELEKSLSLFHRARNQDVVPSISCYQSLLRHLIREEKTHLVEKVYFDMLDVGLGSHSESVVLDFVTRVLIRDRRISDAVKLLCWVKSSGVDPSCTVLDMIADGYCDKRDFDDLLNFLIEWKYVPKTYFCNKILSTVSRDLGTKEAWSLLQDMEALGFCPDAMTFKTLIIWSCKERKLKDAFTYLSELLSRQLRPDLHAYNAIISGLFMCGKWKCAKEVWTDMAEKGIASEASTYRVLLAGYCRERKFNLATVIYKEMVKNGIVSPSPSEDALSKAFTFLGLDCLDLKLKRDNGSGLLKAEFFDSIGNGLYLDTNFDEFEKTLTGTLDDAIIPHFEEILLKEWRKGKIGSALRMKNDLVQCGMALSLSAYSGILKGLLKSQPHIKEAIDLIEEAPELYNQLDYQTLNMLIQTLSINGITFKARLTLDKLLERELLVEAETYTALIMGFCKEHNLVRFQESWELARKNRWLPGFRDMKLILNFLCKQGMLKEVFGLFNSMSAKYPESISFICNVFLKQFSTTGLTVTGRILLEEALQRGLVLEETAYKYLIKGFSVEEKFSEALGLLDMMLRNNTIPSVNTWQLLCPLLFRLNRIEKVICLKHFMMSKQSEAFLLIYKPVINELCREGRIKEATLQLQEMLSGRLLLDNDIIDMMIRGYCKNRRLTKAYELLCIMFRTNMDISISSYRSLVRLSCLEGKVLVALGLQKLMSKGSETQKIISCNVLIFYLFLSGNSLYVESILNEMKEQHFDLNQVTYNFLIYGYYKCGKVAKSIEILITMITKGMRPSNRSFRNVIRSLCSNTDIDKALKVSKEMECRAWKHESAVLYIIVVCLLLHGRLKEAESFLSRLAEKDLISNCTSFDILIKRLCGHGRVNKAIDLLNLMLKKDNLCSEISYSSIIHVLLVHKAYDRALDFLAEMQHKNLKPSIESCNVLIHGLCASGRADDANWVLEVIVQSGLIPLYNMFRVILDAYNAEKNLSKASDLLHKMQQIGYSPDFGIHWSLVSNLSNAKNKDGRNSKGFLSHLLVQTRGLSKDSKVQNC